MGGGNRSGPVDVAATLTAKGQRIDFEVETFIADVAGTLPAGANSTGGHRHPGMGQETADTMLIAHTLRGEGFDASEDGTGRGTPLVPFVLRGHSDYGDGLPCLRAEGGDAGGGSEALIPSPCFAIQERAVSENPNAGPDGMGVGTDIAYTLEARTQVQAIAFDTTQITSKANRSNPKAGDPCHPLAAAAHPPALAYRTSGNCGAWETGDMVDALTTGTDRTSHILAYGITADALDRQGEGAGGTAGERSGLGITEEISPTLRAKRPNAVAYSIMPQNSGKDYKAREVEVAQPLMAGGPAGGNQGGDFILQPQEPFVLAERGREGGSNLEWRNDGTSNAILTPSGGRGGMGVGAIATAWAVRRLTPVECARLQGFPDHHSRIPWRGKPADECPDGPQYKTYGNSFAVPVVRWIGERLARHQKHERTAA